MRVGVWVGMLVGFARPANAVELAAGIGAALVDVAGCDVDAAGVLTDVARAVAVAPAAAEAGRSTVVGLATAAPPGVGLDAVASLGVAPAGAASPGVGLGPDAGPCGASPLRPGRCGVAVGPAGFTRPEAGRAGVAAVGGLVRTGGIVGIPGCGGSAVAAVISASRVGEAAVGLASCAVGVKTDVATALANTGAVVGDEGDAAGRSAAVSAAAGRMRTSARFATSSVEAPTCARSRASASAAVKRCSSRSMSSAMVDFSWATRPTSTVTSDAWTSAPASKCSRMISARRRWSVGE